jgi:hypothetical protein
MPNKIFISYRRKDSRYQARTIYKAFEQVVPRENIFMDIESIPLGADFRKTLKSWVDQCNVLLALIGPGWLDSVDPETGEQRLKNPADFVRIEISQALARDIKVVPVLLDGAPMPEADALPEELKELVYRHAEFVKYEHFDDDVARLIRKLGLVSDQLPKDKWRHSLSLAGTLGAGAVTTSGPPSVASSGERAEGPKLLFSPKAGGSIPKLQIGDSGVFFVGKENKVGALLFPVLTEAQFKVEAVNGAMKVSTRVTDGSGALIAELIRNDWKVAPHPGSWDRNFTDDALEVRDAQGEVILQVRVLVDRIQIQGAWWVNMGSPNGWRRVFIWKNPTNGAAEIAITPKNGQSPPPSIPPMFQYPSELYLGKLTARR